MHIKGTVSLILPLSSPRYDREEPLHDYKNPGFSPETGHFTQVIKLHQERIKLRD